MKEYKKEDYLEGKYQLIYNDELFDVALLKREDGFYVIAHTLITYNESINWARCQTLGNMEDKKALKYYKDYVIFENLDEISIFDVFKDHIKASNHCLNKVHIMYMYRRLWDTLEQVYKPFAYEIGDATCSAFYSQSTYRGELFKGERSLEYYMDAACELINNKKISVADYLMLNPSDIVKAIEIEFGGHNG